MQFSKNDATFYQNNFNFYIGDICSEDTIIFKEDFIVIGNIKTNKNILATSELIVIGDLISRSLYVCKDFLCIGTMESESVEVDGVFKQLDKDVLHIYKNKISNLIAENDVKTQKYDEAIQLKLYDELVKYNYKKKDIAVKYIGINEKNIYEVRVEINNTTNIATLINMLNNISKKISDEIKSYEVKIYLYEFNKTKFISEIMEVEENDISVNYNEKKFRVRANIDTYNEKYSLLKKKESFIKEYTEYEVEIYPTYKNIKQDLQLKKGLSSEKEVQSKMDVLPKATEIIYKKNKGVVISDKESIKKGDIVRHRLLGEGEVIRITDEIIDIDFINSTRRKLDLGTMLRLRLLRKIECDIHENAIEQNIKSNNRISTLNKVSPTVNKDLNNLEYEVNVKLATQKQTLKSDDYMDKLLSRSSISFNCEDIKTFNCALIDKSSEQYEFDYVKYNDNLYIRVGHVCDILNINSGRISKFLKKSAKITYRESNTRSAKFSYFNDFYIVVKYLIENYYYSNTNLDNLKLLYNSLIYLEKNIGKIENSIPYWRKVLDKILYNQGLTIEDFSTRWKIDKRYIETVYLGFSPPNERTKLLLKDLSK